ncbi:ABC transporter ATP-binding protein [Vibrio tarriae]|uniref:ABC transporter ATP-binding protein n=1 Tax=Vibrio tarriae TaxID=2014742 RepID=UPI000DE517F3|nr:ABC transporter ATP-binding protein [Vibrio tarriae]RBM27792.1 ABC transporter ATP-binding protein [Vibrio tarriae]RBM44751.1 ABC transporter ATP-binding protein [Vibrio tarriae]RBM67420.1 ABC transporter ATP-binding protein [Vibrio tarriae]
MSSSNLAIKVDGLGKCFHTYPTSKDRLKQFIIPPVKQFLGRDNTPYYSEFWALRDISFEIEKGESFGIVGRNGSGKSTLLQIITGTLFPTEGNLAVNGRIAALLELGSGFNPEFTGRENVYLNGMLVGLSKREIDERFDDIAAFADIGVHLEQPVKTYSSGMLVRLAFAVQVQLTPDILIVDEALAVGDALFQKRCYQRMEQLTNDGVTLLFVSHDQETVRTLTKKSILLNSGKIVDYGSSSDVLISYRKLLHKQEQEYYQKAVVSLKNSGKKRFDDDNKSFGNGLAEIIKVSIFNIDGDETSVFTPGERIKVRVDCESHADLQNLNIGLRIRNKQGIKVTSWGTLNQDIDVMNDHTSQLIFWNEKVGSGQKISVWFDFECILGANLYEIQATITHEERPDYTRQTQLHWLDEAAFFQVITHETKAFFGGMVDLNMKASWER